MRFEYVLFLSVVALFVKPLGTYMAAVFEGKPTFADPLLLPIEKLLLLPLPRRLRQEMSWKEYAFAFLMFSLVGTCVLYAILRLQHALPGGPADSYLTTPLTPDLGMNTAISFVTTTTWQAYGGETTMRYWTQIAGLVGQNFLAGAAGLAVGIAFIRGYARRDTENLGNFWIDVVRATLWVLLPFSLIGSVLLVMQGVPMNFRPYPAVTGVEGGSQIITQGPVAALELIKNLGTNGGGFFNANGAHPFENPTPLTNWIEMLAIVVLPASLTYTFGKMTGRQSAGWLLLVVMVVLFSGGLMLCDRGERTTPSTVAALHVTGGNTEGKETRFGVTDSVLTAVTTSNGATGSTNAAPDSLSPLGVTIPLSNMLLGEIVFGGLGTGLYSLIITALVGLFMAGLMVGRTPDYLGKRIGPAEMKPVMIFTLMTPIAVLIPTAVAITTRHGLAGLTTNTGPHGFTEILFAFSSCMANNGQTMAGLNANTPFYNITTAAVMMIGRFGLAVPALALAGLLARQGHRPISAGSVPPDAAAFAMIVLGSALVVVGLSFFPALAMGPLIEQLSSASSR